MKNTESIFEYLKVTYGEADLSYHPAEAGQSWITVSPEQIKAIAQFLRDDPELRFDLLMCLSGVHYSKEEMLGVTYHLNSTKHKHSLTLKVLLPENSPRVQSVESIWKTAGWHEREAWDMFGIIFDGHPDLRRILCPDDWEGHPLRKDYQPPEFYGDIKVSY